MKPTKEVIEVAKLLAAMLSTTVSVFFDGEDEEPTRGMTGEETHAAACIAHMMSLNLVLASGYGPDRKAALEAFDGLVEIGRLELIKEYNLEDNSIN
jgi:hypothetical protein